jgi:hypothetical protein
MSSIERRVENLSVGRIIIWNRGAETIHRQDIASANPLRILSSAQGSILDAKCLAINNIMERIRKRKSVREPEAKLMSAADVWDDAQQIAEVLRHNLLKAEPAVQLQVPLSIFMSALDSLSRDELVLLRQRVEERLAA